jgi:hypothetical protein
MEQYRAGDTLYILTDKTTILDKHTGSNIVVQGSTGNDHIVINGKFFADSSVKSPLIIGLIRAEEGCTLKHPEHDDIPLQTGIWEVRRQQEVWNGQVRIVID